MVLLLTLLSPYLLDPECAKGTLFLALTIRERSSRKSIRKVQRNYEVFQRLYRCLDKARIPRRSQLNEEQDLSEPERLHPMSLSSLKPKGSKGLDKAKLATQSTLDAPKSGGSGTFYREKITVLVLALSGIPNLNRKTSALQIGSREGGEASLVEHLPSVKIGLVLHLSTDRASLADWAFSAEFQDSGTKKFLFITGRIRLSILVLEKWVVLSSGRKKRSPYCWSARLSPFPKEYFRMHNLSGNSRLSSLCSSVSRPSSPSIVSSLETSVTSLKSPVSFYPIEAVVPIATVLRPLVGVLSAALAVEFFLISSATSRGLLTRLCFLSGPLLNKNVGRKSVRRLSVGKAKASLLLLLELHKKDGSGEKSYPQAFAYRMVEGGRGSNTFRLMLDHCIRDISNELSDL
ncbi:hypothetical protein L1987_89400 [Smallanthus sonchifolius]|nr:hypothetical protein L1987_89400 [Smallanthus sonchifolius]